MSYSIEELLERLDRDQSWKEYQVHYPPCENGKWTIKTYSIPRNDFQRLRFVVKEGVSRDSGWGDGFTQLTDGTIGWMSDTKAEILEHGSFFSRLKLHERYGDEPARVLINGLGLGMAVKGALKHGAGHIDVVEIDEDLINLISPLIDSDRVTYHHGDALTYPWPPKTKWDVAWHDIWPEISADNWPSMRRLHTRYGQRTYWQSSWNRDWVQQLRKENR